MSTQSTLKTSLSTAFTGRLIVTLKRSASNGGETQSKLKRQSATATLTYNKATGEARFHAYNESHAMAPVIIAARCSYRSALYRLVDLELAMSLPVRAVATLKQPVKRIAPLTRRAFLSLSDFPQPLRKRG